MIYGNAVAIDGAEAVLDIRIDGGELTLENMTGGELGVFYPVGGATDYSTLGNKPKINGVTVIGEKTGPEYGLQNTIGDITPQDIDQMIYGG